MSVAFKPLWKLLIDRDMTREDLRQDGWICGVKPPTSARDVAKTARLV